ncbi:MAG: glycosyltransferase family 2 protein [Bacteroidales bacterium]|nr:glycosyltransferase family 2 protein [Bacteroidales bacterium]
MDNKIFAVIVTYNGKKWYDRSIGRLATFNPEVEIIVVDNASSDGSAGYIREQFPSVHLMESGENLGFAKANNLAIRYALDHGADYVLLLNQDAWVEEDTVAGLVATFEENTSVGIAVPMQLDGSGAALDYYFAQNLSGLFVSDAYGHTLQPYYDIRYAPAAAWMLSRACFETVGGFDTDLFSHYGEDENYCQRLHFHGLRMVLGTRCAICHDHRSVKDGDNYAGRKLWQERNQTLADKITLANICRADIHIDQLIMAARARACLAACSLMFGPCRAYRERVALLKQIQASRTRSEAQGPHWL